MLAADLINSEIPVLKPGDTVERALQWMNDFRLDQLLYADGNTYLGLFTEEMLLNFDDEDKLEAMMPQFPERFVMDYQHIYEILGLISGNDITLVAVLDEEKRFAGTILASEVLRSFVSSIGFAEPGAVVEISLKNRDYSLAEVARLIESEKVKIIGSYITGSTHESLNWLKLTIKLNRKDISSLLSTLSRFGFEVEAYHTSEPVESLDKDRYEMLMKYLSI